MCQGGRHFSADVKILTLSLIFGSLKAPAPQTELGHNLVMAQKTAGFLCTLTGRCHSLIWPALKMSYMADL